MGRFEYVGTTEHVHLISRALAQGNYPFEHMARHPGVITIEVTDLSSYGARAAGDHDHVDHVHTEEYDLLGYRGRVLGLFWYSGKIQIDISLVDDYPLFGEVLWSELAHAVDRFELDPERRRKIWALFHYGQTETSEHSASHGWFETPFSEWTGEME